MASPASSPVFIPASQNPQVLLDIHTTLSLFSSSLSLGCSPNASLLRVKSVRTSRARGPFRGDCFSEPPGGELPSCYVTIAHIACALIA